MERSFAVGVVTSITNHISQLDIMWRWLVDPLTIGTFTIAAVVISEATGDGECMTAGKDIFSLRANQGGPENSGTFSQTACRSFIRIGFRRIKFRVLLALNDPNRGSGRIAIYGTFTKQFSLTPSL